MNVGTQSRDHDNQDYVCPSCASPLVREKGSEFHCKQCETIIGKANDTFDNFMLDEPFDPEFHQFYEGEGTRGDDEGGPRISAQQFKVPHILEVLPENYEPNRWLDAGCGGGWILEELLNVWSDTTATGIDISETRLAEAKQRNPSVDFIRTPVESVPYPDDYFDLVTCIDVIEHVPDPDQLLQEIRRIANKLVIKFPIEDTLFDRFQKNFWWPFKRRLKALLGFDPELDPFEPHLRRYHFEDARETVRSENFRVRNEVISENPWEDNHATLYPPAYNITEDTPLLRKIDFHTKRSILLTAMRLTHLLSETVYYRVFNSGIYLYCESGDSNS